MRKILPTLLAWITGKKRYETEYFKWDNTNLVHSFYRLFEYVFWRKGGIRAESAQRVFLDKEGKVNVAYKFYTKEYLLAHIEIELRKYIKKVFTETKLKLKYWKWNVDRLIPQLADIFNVFEPEYALVSYGKVKKTENSRGAYLLAIAYVRTVYVGNTSTTLDGGSGSNRMIIATAHTTNGGSENLTAVSWNSESFTKCGNSYENDHPSSRFLSNWKLAPTGTGSQTLAFTASPVDYDTYTSLYTGVKNSSVPKNQAYNKGGPSISSLSLSITAGSTDWLVGCGDNTAATMNAGSNTTVRDAGNPSSWGMVDSNGVSSPTALNISWSGGGYGALNGFAMEEQTSNNYTKDIAETVTLVETTSKRITAKLLKDAITLVDTVRRGAGKLVTSSLTLVETTTKNLILNKNLTDVVTLVETTRARISAKVLTEAVTLAEAFREYLAAIRLTETVTLAETFSKIRGQFKALTETVTLAETFAKVIAFGRSFTESITVTDRIRGLLNGLNMLYNNKYTAKASTYFKKYLDQK